MSTTTREREGDSLSRSQHESSSSKDSHHRRHHHHHHRSSRHHDEPEDLSVTEQRNRTGRRPLPSPQLPQSNSRYQSSRGGSGGGYRGGSSSGSYRDRREDVSPRRRSRSPPSASYGNGRRRQIMGSEEEKQVKEWVEGEDSFALKQAKKGAVIRIKEGRARPVDWLALNLQTIDKEKDVYDEATFDTRELDIPVPYAVIEGLGLAEVEKLGSDVREYLRLERSKFNRDFWESMLVICNDTKQRLLAKRSDADHGALQPVSEDIENLLQGKDYDALVALESRVELLLSSDSAVDVDFWTALKEELLIRKAKAKLERIHAKIIQERVRMLKEEQAAEASSVVQEIEGRLKEKAVASEITYSADMDEVPKGENVKNVIEMKEFKARIESAQQSVERIGFIPLKAADAAVKAEDDGLSTNERLFEKEVAKSINENEEVFDNEADLGAPAQSTRIKPRYFNRVQMGFDWNKYNQTHYSADNPPPKIVQGYKFNIFYPELADSARAPTYRIIRDKVQQTDEEIAAGGQVNTCIIKFIAGEPYQDLAFRIVDREWNYSSKRENGFRSSFDKGILQLHFRFKKIFYRK
ncbi:cactin [Myxozyma melibiosi]|uniref:Splicing factor Cactin n=1 Tax=Myxozyma melibiosi TaxID=54550 RepID=A0ABR1FEP3_9ASCO